MSQNAPPQNLKQLLQMQAYVAEKVAVIAAATNANTEGRHLEVLGIFGGAEPSSFLRKVGLPAMSAWSTCNKVLISYFILKFKRYWRLYVRFEKEGNQRKIHELDIKLRVFEKPYSLFQSAHDKALFYIDSIYNQFATREAIVGAQKEEGEDETQGLSWIASGLGVLAKKRISQKIAKLEHPSFERKNPFRYPTFNETLEIARLEVVGKEEPKVPKHEEKVPVEPKPEPKPAPVASDRPKEVLFPNAGSRVESDVS